MSNEPEVDETLESFRKRVHWGKDVTQEQWDKFQAICKTKPKNSFHAVWLMSQRMKALGLTYKASTSE